MKRRIPAWLFVPMALGILSCGPTDDGPGGATDGSGGSDVGSGGAVGSGGHVGSGGAGPGSGGTVGSGGAIGSGGTGPGSGGSVGSGGAVGSGGQVGTGGAGAGSGGSVGSGGAVGSGGRQGTGGAAAGTGGAPGSGGKAGTGGAMGTGGSAPGTGGSSAMCGSVANSATRPQLTSAQAATYTIATYLAQSDNWDPTAGLGSASSFTANFTVATDGSGTHTTVQAAINAAASGTARRYILIKPGTYRGAISYSGATPLTLYGADTDATKVTIVNNQSASSAGGTGQSATFKSTSKAFEMMNLTVSNDFATPASGTNIQAVALYVTGDKTVLQNIRLHGFQDTLFTDTASETTASRVYMKNCYIEGDTDFIFGGATLVIDGGTVNYLSSRKGSGGGACLAPSTRVSNNYGFLVINSSFTSDAGAPSNKVSLGRSWDEGGPTPTPNGQAVVRETTMAAHIRKVDPWAAAATSGRAFSATGNRFDEYCNSGPGSGP